MSGNEQTRSGSGNGEGTNGIPDDLRCKRSDGKQWRCTAMSMPDKTVCEKHYIQAKRRAANSAFRASQKKAKRKGETDTHSEGRLDEIEMPINSIEHYSNSPASAKIGIKEKRHNSMIQYSGDTPMMKNYSGRAGNSNDESSRDVELFEDSYRSYRTQSVALMDASRSKSYESMSPMEYSAASTDVSPESVGQICHQCQRKDWDRIISCQKCNKRAFCDTCISTRYSEISLEEIEKVCPACRGLCNCKPCLRSDTTIKLRIEEISILDKLQYLYRLLSAVLPVIKQIHIEQCTEVELEKKLRGAEIDLVRARLKADEQMCCNICRIPVVDYYRHCSNCSYDLCIRCCQDLRAESSVEISGSSQIVKERTEIPKLKLNFSSKFPEWEANSDGSIPCPPKEYGGCGSQSLNLARIFKMNWVAKLVKNAEEMVNGCKVSDMKDLKNTEMYDSRFSKLADRDDNGDNFVYSPSLETIKSEGVTNFEKQWAEGQVVIVKGVLEESSFSRWNPEKIWRDIDEFLDEKPKEQDPLVKAIDCLDGSEVEVRLGEFLKAYVDGRNRDTNLPLLWKLKDWPSPSATEEFIFYQRPEFIRRLPFLEYIHPRLGLLNVAAKLPHYSLQNDAGPKIYVSCGTYKELGPGDSVTNIHYSMRDMVYLLVHTSEATLEGIRETKRSPGEFDGKIGESEPLLCPEGKLEDRESCDLTLSRINTEQNEPEMMLSMNPENGTNDENMESSCSSSAGAEWDVFRRQDVPKLAEFLQRTLQKPDGFKTDFVSRPLFEGLFLNEHHKKQLKDEFGVEPWTFEQHRGEAIFIPAGCPYQVRHLKSNVQLALDFLCPESVGEAAKLAEEIRCLPNDHESKLQILEIGKISLYAASSAIKEVQKLVLDPKLGAELGFLDRNLTEAVSENLEKAVKRPQIRCP